MTYLQFSPSLSTADLVGMTIRTLDHILCDAIAPLEWSRLQSGNWPDALGVTTVTQDADQITLRWTHPDGSQPEASWTTSEFEAAIRTGQNTLC